MRPDLISLLFRQGRSSVGAIAQNFRLSRPAISHYLKVIKEAGVIAYEKVGQEKKVFILLVKQGAPSSTTAGDR